MFEFYRWIVNYTKGGSVEEWQMSQNINVNSFVNSSCEKCEIILNKLVCYNNSLRGTYEILIFL